MTADSTVASARIAAEAKMSDRCQIERPGARGPLNTTTGKHERVMAVVHPDLICQVQYTALDPRSVDAGETDSTEARSRVDVPWSTTVKAGDFITITAVGPQTPPDLLGTKYRVVRPVQKSRASALRLLVEVKS